MHASFLGREMESNYVLNGVQDHVRDWFCLNLNEKKNTGENI